jgi:hypothetical protein
MANDEFTVADGIEIEAKRAKELFTRINQLAQFLPIEKQGELMKIANELRGMEESLKKAAERL